MYATSATPKSPSINSTRQHDHKSEPSSSAIEKSKAYRVPISVAATIAGAVLWGMTISFGVSAYHHEAISVSTLGELLLGVGGAALLATIALVAARHFHRKKHNLENDLLNEVKWTVAKVIFGPLAVLFMQFGLFSNNNQKS